MRFYIFKRNETLDVLLLPHKGTNMYSFVNLSKGHICPCLFPSIDAASRPSLADPILHFFIIFRNTHIPLPIPFLWAKKKAPAMRKSLLALLTCHLLIFYRYGITARAFLRSTRCNTPDGRTWARTERELRRRRKRR